MGFLKRRHRCAICDKKISGEAAEIRVRRNGEVVSTLYAHPNCYDVMIAHGESIRGESIPLDLPESWEDFAEPDPLTEED